MKREHAHEALQRALDAERARQGDTPRRRRFDHRRDWLTAGNLLRAALIVALYLAVSTMEGQEIFAQAEPAALCTTDTDCMRLCPAEDEECDGGPE